MNQPWTQLRRAVLAFAFAGTLGFGATQAVAAPDQARFRGCTWTVNGPALDPECDERCRAEGWDWGYCHTGQCICSMLSGPA
jgi:hypothetical protein